MDWQTSPIISLFEVALKAWRIYALNDAYATDVVIYSENVLMTTKFEVSA